MDMPGKYNKVDASILCRLLEENTMTETFIGPQQPLHFLFPTPQPTPTPILKLHRSNKQVFSMLHIIQIDL